MLRREADTDSLLTNLLGWLVAVAATAIYLLTLEPSVSFWDCGEFIATSHSLQVGHPPGAPLYQLMAHCFTLMAGADASRVAWWSNALSAVAGGLTAMFLFWTVVRLLLSLSGRQDDRRGETTSFWHVQFPALIASACYTFCDTAWFSATESEVYSLSMLFSSAIFWAMMRWSHDDACRLSSRWLLLIAFLLGLSVCVHQLSLLTLPAIVVCWAINRHRDGISPQRRRSAATGLLFALLFFVLGLTPYAIVPIRAAADTPINMGNPSTLASFRDYFTRAQYEHAPLVYGRCYNSPIVAYEDGKPVYAKEMDMLFPRMWKSHPHADQYYSDWCGRHGKMVDVDGRSYYKPSFIDNVAIFGAYQLGYMYLRYLMWNFSGRYNDRQGFGNLQKGQFITGIPFIDHAYIGTSRPLPPSMPRAGHNRYFLLPLVLGIVGMLSLFRRSRRWGWVVFTLFATTSLLLSIYLNHPMYEPRERDYAYILSFYAFALWIGVGANGVFSFVKAKSKVLSFFILPLLVFVPLLMAFQNWDDHDRSGRFVARDSAANLLNSCDKDAILITLGDNDTYPLWYMQQVEHFRTDVQIVNLSLLGSDSYLHSVAKQLAISSSPLENQGPYRRMTTIASLTSRPLFFSHYAAADPRLGFRNRLQLCGIAYRLCDSIPADTVNIARSCHLFADGLRWRSLEGVYIDELSNTFLRQYWDDLLLLASNLADRGMTLQGRQLLDTAMRNADPRLLCDMPLLFDVAHAYLSCADTCTADALMRDCQQGVSQQLDYYASMSPRMQSYIPYTLEPLLRLRDIISAPTQ